MKQSMFNEYFVAADGAKLAFNSYSCGLAVVDEKYEQLIEIADKLNFDNIPLELKECFDAAYEGHFIVDDDLDELVELSTKRNFQKYSIDSLGLTIAPTLLCNFKCIYCYETSKHGRMGEEVYKGIVDFVKGQSSYLHHFGVTWYGGEPLLEKDIIYRLSEDFLKICEENGIEYNAFMISNGSLLDDDIISNMKKYHIDGIQITVDGPPEIHNSRRVSKNGTDTFDTILDNVNKLLNVGDIEVVLRINVDKSNQSEVENLIAILSERLVSKDVKISFGQVTAYTDACKAVESSCYNNGEFAVEIIKFYEMLRKYGFADYNKFPYPEIKLNYCCAELVNSFVVDHEGYLYKCWNEVGNTANSVGNLANGSYDISCCKNGAWMQRNPICDEKCSRCSLLPVCMGGCPYNDMVLKTGSVCDMIKYNIQDIMLKYYEMLKEGV